MDMDTAVNYVQLCGALAEAPVFSHRARGEDFYTFPMEVLRLSGCCDRVNIILRRRMLEELEVTEGRLSLTGELRSYNNRSGIGAKLVITVFARELGIADAPDTNYVRLCGTLCKPPRLRETPLGREVCDLMLAVNRSCGRSDYLPCICWGAKAREAAQWQVGDRLRLTGRIQSRTYMKLLGDSVEERTAFEVSASEAELLV